MKATILLTLFVLLLAITSCSPQKDIQAERGVWVLVDKQDAFRLINGRYSQSVKLIWLTPKNIRAVEYVTKQEADEFYIGQTVINRDFK